MRCNLGTSSYVAIVTNVLFFLGLECLKVRRAEKNKAAVVTTNGPFLRKALLGVDYNIFLRNPFIYFAQNCL